MREEVKNKESKGGLVKRVLLAFALVGFCAIFHARDVQAAYAVHGDTSGYDYKVCTASDCIGEPEETNTFLIYTKLTEIKNYLLQEILPAINMASIAVVKTSAGIIETLSRLTQAQIDNKFDLAKASASAHIAVNKATTVPGNNLMCHAIRVNQVEYLTKLYAKTLGEFLSANTYDFSFGADGGGEYKCIGPNAGHGAAKDGNPASADCDAGVGVKDAKRARCFLGTWDPADYPEDVGGYCGNEGVDSKVGKDPDDLDPAMRLADTRMDTIFGSLEFVSKNTSESKNPAQKAKDETLKKKRQFLAAVNYCYNVYGFPPRRPVGKQPKEHPDEATRIDLWEAQNSPVLHKCLQIVAEHTKPNCPGDDEKMKMLCAAQKKICDNAKAHGIDVSVYVDDGSGACPESQGLSYAEVQEIARLGCLPDQEYIDIAATTTASQAEIALAARACEAGIVEYRANQRAERDAFGRLVLDRVQLAGPIKGLKAGEKK